MFFSKNDDNTKHTLYFDENIHRPATLLQNSVFGLKIIDGFGDCGVLAILFSILSGASQTQKIIAEKVYKFIHQFEKTFTLKDFVAEIFQIKYLRQALFHAKLYKNLSDKQKTSNMFDLSDFIDDDDIFPMRDKIVKLLEQKKELEDELKRTPKKQDKETIKKRLAPINKELHHSYPTYEKKYNDAKSKFMISTEQTLNEDDIYWLTNNDMINLPLIASIGVLCVYDNSKNINQNRWSNCIISDMGYHAMTNKHLFSEADYFILLRFLDNSHWELFYDRNSNRAIFSTKLTAKNRPYHQIMKFCDPKTKYILTGKKDLIKPEMYKSFYGLPETAEYHDFAPPFANWCKTSFEGREQYYNIDKIEWLNITEKYINDNPKKSDQNDESILHRLHEQESIPVIFRPKIEDEDTTIEENINRFSLYNLCYITKTPNNQKNQLALYDFNNQIFNMERIHKYLKDLTYKKDEIDKFTLQDYSLYSIPSEKDLIQCKQLIMWYIFRAKIHKDQLFFNDLCYQYFGEGYITNFAVDDIKAGCRALMYQAIHKKEKMILCQMMNIYNQTEAIYCRFIYFYHAEFRKDDIFNDWFYSKLPQFSVNYKLNSNLDGKNEYISFIFLDLLKLYEHHNIQEKNISEKMNKINVLVSNEHPQYFQILEKNDMNYKKNDDELLSLSISKNN